MMNFIPIASCHFKTLSENHHITCSPFYCLILPKHLIMYMQPVHAVQLVYLPRLYVYRMNVRKYPERLAKMLYNRIRSVPLLLIVFSGKKIFGTAD